MEKVGVSEEERVTMFPGCGRWERPERGLSLDHCSWVLGFLWVVFGRCLLFMLLVGERKKGEWAREKGGKDGREEKEKPCSLATVGESAQSVGCL